MTKRISQSLFKNRLLMLALLISVWPAGLHAAALTLDPSGKTIENVAIAKDASVRIDNRSFRLDTVGSGLRSKKVAIVNVKVYVAQLFVSNATNYQHGDPASLDSASAMSESAVRLDFLRSVDAQSVQLAFRDSLVANGVDLNDPAIQQFLNAVSAGGDAAEGKPLTLIFERNSNASTPAALEQVTYEDTNGKLSTVAGKAGLIKNLLSIWLGVTTDSGLSKLKSALISGS